MALEHCIYVLYTVVHDKAVLFLRVVHPEQTRAVHERFLMMIYI